MDTDDYDDDDFGEYDIFNDPEEMDEDLDDDEDRIYKMQDGKDADKKDESKDNNSDSESDDEVEEDADAETSLTSRHVYITKFEVCRIIEALAKLVSDKNFTVPDEIPLEILDVIDIAYYWLMKTNLPIPFLIVRGKTEVDVRTLKIDYTQY